MPKIAELTIEIKNESDKAVASLQKLRSALSKVSTDFSDVKFGGLQDLYKRVSQLNRILQPLGNTCETISHAFNLMGVRATSSLSKTTASAQKAAKATEEIAQAATSVKEVEAPKVTETKAEQATVPVQLEVRGQSAIEQSIARLAELKVMMRDVRANGDLNSPQTQAEIIRLNEAIKSESAELRRLQSEANQTGNSTKNMASRVSSATAMFKKIAPVLKTVKSALKSFGSAFSGLGKSIKGINLPFTGLLKQFARMFRLKAMRMVIQQVMAAFKEGTDNLYEYSRALDSTDSANFKNVMDQYNSAFLKLKNSIGAAVAPLLQQLLPVVQTVISALIRALNLLNQFISLMQGKKTYTRAADYMAEYKAGVDGATGSVKELRRTLLSFDEIHRLDMETPSSGGGSGSPGADASQMFEEALIDSDISKFFDNLKKQFDKLGIEQKIKNIKKAWEEVKTAIINLVNDESFQYLVGTAFSMVLTGIEGVLRSAKGIIEGIQKAIDNLDKNGKIDALREGWEKVTEAVGDFFNSEGFQALLDTVIDLGVTALTGLFETLSSVINNIVIPALDELEKEGVFDGIKEAWSGIWDSIKSISESEVFQALIKGTLKTAIEGIKSVLEGMEGILNIIDGILNGDTSKIESGLTKIGTAFMGLFNPLFELADQAFGTDLAKQNRTLIAAIQNGRTYQQQLRAEQADELHERDKNGNIWNMVAPISAQGYAMTDPAYFQEVTDKALNLNDALEALQQWHWDSNINFMPDEESMNLAFNAYIATAPEDVVNAYRTKSWELLTPEETELAFNSWIETSPDWLVQKYKEGGWDKLPDSQKLLGLAAYITSSGKDVSQRWIDYSWGKLNGSDKTVGLDAEIETDPKDLSNDMQKGWNASKMPLATEAELNEKLSKKNLERGMNNAWKETTNKNKLYAPVSVEDRVGRTLWDDTDSKFKSYTQGKNLIVNSKANSQSGSTLWTQISNLWTTFTNGKTVITNTSANPSSGNSLWSKISELWTTATNGKTVVTNTSANGNSGTTLWERISSLWTTATNGKTVTTNTTVPDNTGTSLWSKVSNLWNGLSSDTKTLNIFSKIATNASTMWSDISSRWDTDNSKVSGGKHMFPIESYIKTWASTMWNDISGRWDSATAGKSLSVDVTANISSTRGFKDALSYELSGTAISVEQKNGKWVAVAYANGGFPDAGQLFIANEAGPELVGQIGSKNAVANTEQIISGIANGVSQAMQSQNAILSRQNDLLEQIARKDPNISVSSVLGAMNNVNKRTGIPVVTMG